MLGDLCDEVELETGRRADGSFYAVFWWFIKMGSAFASFITGVLIWLSTFDEKQPSLMDSVIGPLRELSVAGLTEQAGVNFNVMTIATVLALSGLVGGVFAVRNHRKGAGRVLLIVLAGLGCFAGAGALGWSQTQKSSKDAEPIPLTEKFSAVTNAVAAADTYFMEREELSISDDGHYAELRGLLAEIQTGTLNLYKAEKDGELDLEVAREESERMAGVALRAMRQSPKAMFRFCARLKYPCRSS